MTAHWAKDALVEAACDAQRDRGLLPATSETETYMASVMERMDREEARKHAAQPSRLDSETLQGEYAARVSRGTRPDRGGHRPSESVNTVKDARIERTPIRDGGAWIDVKTMNTAEKRMRERIRMLRRLPDWRRKLERVNPLAIQGLLGEEKQREADIEVRKVLEAADIKLGPWWKAPPARPLWFTG